MKTIIAGMVAAVILSAGAAALLNGNQRLAYQAYSTSGARVSDPGHNLVGPDWSAGKKS